MTRIWKYQTEGSGWTIDSVMEQNINISRYKPLYGISYTKLSKELNYSRNKCLKSFLIKKNTLVSKNTDDEIFLSKVYTL